MGENTKIEWAHHSWNPWVGCTKVSAACDHCYAEAWAKRAGSPELWAGERRRTSAANWKQPLRWNKAAAAAGERHRVFCASLADVFDNQVPIAWRKHLWMLIAECRNLDWLLLTKRPQNIAKMLPPAVCEFGSDMMWPWPHVWLGTTAEDQIEADRRIPHLLAIPAAVRFLSCEPVLAPINLEHHLGLSKGHDDLAGLIGWIICGGESGGKARDMDPNWARALRDQCAGAGTAFFMKQMARGHPIPPDLRVRQFPKAA